MRSAARGETLGDLSPAAVQAAHDRPLFRAERLRGLAVGQPEAVVAVDVLGLSYREAAQALGTKEGTIMSRLHRGRGQIAERLAPDG